MAMKIGYRALANKVKEILLESNFFVVGHADAYVRQVLRQKKIPGAPFPVVLIYIPGSEEGLPAHQQIGYHPRPVVEIVMEVLTAVPNAQTTEAMKTLLGVTSVKTPEQCMDENYIITDELQAQFRSSENRKLQDELTPNVHHVLPGRTAFRDEEQQGKLFAISQTILPVLLRLVDDS